MTVRVAIMRGPSGSGKSTLVRKLIEEHPNLNKKSCSADDFMMVDGKYVFDPSKLKENHKKCFARFIMMCGIAYELEEDSLIIVDNTNIKQWEFKHYVEIAKRLGFKIEYHIPEGDWVAKELAERNKHGVSLEVCQRMIDNFEPNLE